MDIEKLDDIVQNNIVNLEEWTDIVNKYMSYTFGRIKLDKEEASKLTFETAEALYSILQIFIGFGKFKDKWKDSGFRPFVYGIYYEVESEKMGKDFQFGVDEKGMYLQAYLSFAENLKNMNDDFWKLFLELENYGDFQFVENSYPSSREHPQLFKGYKSNLYRLTRNYFLSEMGHGDLENLGWLVIRWDREHSFDTILKNGCLAFKILYQLKYSLWKISDLRSKKK